MLKVEDITKTSTVELILQLCKSLDLLRYTFFFLKQQSKSTINQQKIIHHLWF